MAIARLHGGPLDGQVIPLQSEDQDSLIAPYGNAQIVYQRKGEPTHTGSHDGPTEAAFWFVEATDDLGPNDD